MALTLFIGRPEDGLWPALVRTRCGGPVALVDEHLLFDDTPFALTTTGSHTEVRLTVFGQEMTDNQIAGIVLRPSGTWGPTGIADPQDRLFVQHETLAAWLSVFAALDTVVFNRYPVAWWVRDPALSIRLVEVFGALWNWDEPAGRSGHSRDCRCFAGIRSVYLVGRGVIPGTGCSRTLADRLSARQEAFQRWHDATGLLFARLDFSADADRLLAVEPMPQLEAETVMVQREVARQIWGVVHQSRSITSQTSTNQENPACC